MMSVPKLRFERIQKFRFHRSLRGHVETTEVLRDIELEFAAGERVAVAGPAGAGKTTLLRLACRLEEPNGGMIFLDDRDVRTVAVRELRRRVGLVFQNHVLFGESVEDNVCYGLRVRGHSREAAREAASPVLERLGLDHSFFDRKNTSLNAGQVSRVVLARTLVLEPEVLLLDEPAAHLDPATAADLFAVIEGLATEASPTVLCATTRLEEARMFARRIILLVEGEVVADLPADEFLAGAVPDKARRFLNASGY
jgi:ABC-type methionine transport system ATPase subunit